MVKKKSRNLPTPEPVDAEPTCKHIRKGLEEGAVKKALVNVDWTLCQDCQAESKEKTNNEEEERTEAQVIWLCLKCGHRGCGRYSEHQHALNHYNTPRSEPHCLVLNVGQWTVWCYICDCEVQYSSSGRLQQLLDYIQKKSKTNGKMANAVQSGAEDRNSENQPEEEPQVVEAPSRAEKGAAADNTSNDNKEVTVKGLSNLGNTCFFNAVMQNLTQAPTLRELLSDIKHPGKTVTLQVSDVCQPMPQEVMLEQQPGPLTLAMWQFLTEMQETKKGVVTPRELFSQICKKAIRFKGYQQQDSQELLRYLLDGMRGEEIQRVGSAISKTLQAASEKIEDEDVKKIVRDCEKRRAIPNFVDRLFGGELTSTIMCDTCHTVSLVHEPFLDLSLPVLDDLPAKKNTAKSAKAACKKNEEDSDNDSYVKDRNDLPSGPSKHLQKKAKKQAKKQAKSQRRQQKIQDKTLRLNDSNNEDEDSIPDQNNVQDNNCEQQDESSANVMSSSITSDVDMEKEEEDLGHLEHKEPCETNLENNPEPSSKSLESQHNEVTADLEISCDLNRRSPHKTEPNQENEDQPSEEVTANLENGDVNQSNIDSDEGQEARSPESPQTELEPVDNLLTESLNRLNLCSDLERLNLSSNLGPNDIEIQIIDEAPTATTQIYEVVNEDPRTAFCTLADRKELHLDEWSVLSCLYQFTRKEDLVGSNQLLCNTCTQRQAKTIKRNNKEKKFVYTNAKKQMLVSAPPPILTLHLKRFQQNGFNLHKINKHIKFSEVIDLAPFSTVKCKNICEGEDRLLYSLYGVIEHSGTMRSGHYTAYVKSRTPNPHLCHLVLQGALPDVPSREPTKGHWFHISDSQVQAVPLNKVLNSQAYLLFYERIV